MTGYKSKKAAAQDKLLDDDDIQVYKRPWVGLTKEDMPAGENPMFDHEYFIKGMVFAAYILKEKNNG